MSDEFLTLDELKKIPLDEYPFIVFADNIRGLFSWAVKVRTKGSYGHLMWLTDRNTLATQSWYFHKATLDDYSECNMKFVSNPSWIFRNRGIRLSMTSRPSLDSFLVLTGFSRRKTASVLSASIISAWSILSFPSGS
jgi:hypothetical protein